MKALTFLSLALALTSCATIKQGKYQNVCINSTPQGANIWMNQALIGQTPTAVCLKRGEAQQVCIQMDGFKPYYSTLYPTVSGWVFGNIVFGGLVGVAIDAYTGSMYKLTPNQLHACLESENDVIVSEQEGNECQVIVVTDVNPSWEKIDSLEPIQ